MNADKSGGTIHVIAHDLYREKRTDVGIVTICERDFVLPKLPEVSFVNTNRTTGYPGGWRLA
jgi:hypothetical protein